MSSVWVAVALVATFSAIAMAGVAVQVSFGDRRRTLRILERDVEPVPDLRERQLAGSFGRRVAWPAASRVRDAVVRFTPVGTRERLARKLELAGSPAGWDAEKVVAMKAIGGVGGFVLGLFARAAGGFGGAFGLAVVLGVAVLGFVAPSAFVGQAAVNRQDRIRKALPDTMDLLVISVEAGLGFDAALAQVAASTPGPLSEEIARMLHEMRLGVTRADALRQLAKRTDVEELNSFSLAMIQADAFGVSIGNVLRGQARELRVKRRQRAEGQAMKTPVKLVFPLVFCVLPTLFVVVVGPGVIRIAQSFFG